MFRHMFVGTNDVAASRRFYNATMSVLGHSCHENPTGSYYESENCRYIVCTPHNGEPATPMNGFVLAFAADECADVDAWYKAGLENGGTDYRAPEFNPRSPGNMYCAYLRDPDGNLLSAYALNPDEQT